MKIVYQIMSHPREGEPFPVDESDNLGSAKNLARAVARANQGRSETPLKLLSLLLEGKETGAMGYVADDNSSPVLASIRPLLREG